MHLQHTAFLPSTSSGRAIPAGDRELQTSPQKRNCEFKRETNKECQ